MQLRFITRDRATDSSEVVHLPEHARKRRFTALVRTRDDQYPLVIVKVEAVAHRLAALLAEFNSKRQIITVRAAHRLVRRGHLRIAKWRIRKRADIFVNPA